MQTIEVVPRNDSGPGSVRVGGIELPLWGLSDVSCYVRPDCVTEVTLTYQVSSFKVLDKPDFGI